jgi:hypothetical protein
MTFAKYLAEVAHQKQFMSNWRMGQTYFNVLTEVKPVLAEKIRGTAIDPFHDDKNIANFLTEVCFSWDIYRPMQ